VVNRLHRVDRGGSPRWRERSPERDRDQREERAPMTIASRLAAYSAGTNVSAILAVANAIGTPITNTKHTSRKASRIAIAATAPRVAPRAMALSRAQDAAGIPVQAGPSYQAQQHAGSGIGEREAGNAAGGGKQKSFSQYRQHKPHATRSERHPNRGVPLPRDAASQKQPGDIGARKQQQQPGDRNQRHEWFRKYIAQQ
jgi:hypothetical protein